MAGKVVRRAAALARGQAMPCVAFLLACASLVVAAVGAGPVAALSGVPAAIDWRVLALMFCLMAAVAGLRESGAAGAVARRLVMGRATCRRTCLVLVLLPFFASMLVTNDVALLTFTPLAVMALLRAGWQKVLAPTVVLQAIAANLGGMVTPFGNPQNLFIFTAFDLQAADFFAALAPFGALALVLLVLACAAAGGSRAQVDVGEPDQLDARRLALHAALFALAVLAVLRAVPWEVAFALTLAVLLAADRAALACVDFGLLVTFACFFVFSANMAAMPALQGLLAGWMDAHPMLTSLLASQVVSNVPAAVLLSDFTQNWRSLLIGVDIGGLGTPIASLASLIAYRLYLQAPGAGTGRFMRVFAVANVLVLVAMVALYAALYVA